MGLWDALKKTPQKEKEINTDEISPNKIINSTEPPILNNCQVYFGNHQIPNDILDLLWYADGPLMNYQNERSTKIYSDNQFITRASPISCSEERGAIYAGMPIGQIGANTKIDRYLVYKELSPSKRALYLNWLTNIENPIEPGYVFMFYSGLERHLVYGKYKEASQKILTLQNLHQDPYTKIYSRTAILMSSIIHNDPEILTNVPMIEEMDAYYGNVLLNVKYHFKQDLSPEDILSLSSAVRFENKRYIKGYPELFAQKISDVLEKEYGRATMPFYNISTKYEKKSQFVFLSTCLTDDLRNPELLAIVWNKEFCGAIGKILAESHEMVKEDIASKRKDGIKISPITPKVEPVLDSTSSNAFCPYCSKQLDKMPVKKTKCPDCGQYMYSRTSPKTREKILVREDQVAEIEAQWQKYHLQKEIQNIFEEYHVDSETKAIIADYLKERDGNTPTNRDIAWQLLDEQLQMNVHEKRMIPYRNNLMRMANFSQMESNFPSAIKYYGQVCFMDINGPIGVGGFDPNSERAVIYPNICRMINDFLNKTGNQLHEMKPLLMETWAELQIAVNAPVSPENAWIEFEKVFNDTNPL